MASRAHAALIAVALVALAAPASAQQPVARDPALADALFRTGVEALGKGDYATACPKFRASMELDPAVSTMLNIAKCDLHDDKLARAWADFQRALVLNRDTPGAQRQKELEDYTRKAIAALEARLPRLRITVSGAPPGLSLRRDGESLPPGVLGEALPTDPGPHRVEASAPGYRTESREIVLEEGKTQDVTLTLSVEGAPPPVVPPPVVPPPVVPPPVPASGSGIPSWAWGIGGLGLAWAGFSAGFAADGAGTVSRLHHDCPAVNGTPTCPRATYTQADVDALNARKNRDLGLAVAAGVTSGVLIVVATVGIARRGGARDAAPRGAPASGWTAIPWVGPGAAGAGLSFRF